MQGNSIANVGGTRLQKMFSKWRGKVQQWVRKGQDPPSDPPSAEIKVRL